MTTLYSDDPALQAALPHAARTNTSTRLILTDGPTEPPGSPGLIVADFVRVMACVPGIFDPARLLVELPDGHLLVFERASEPLTAAEVAAQFPEFAARVPKPATSGIEPPTTAPETVD